MASFWDYGGGLMSDCVHLIDIGLWARISQLRDTVLTYAGNTFMNSGPGDFTLHVGGISEG
jgi:hypothetical protein